MDTISNFLTSIRNAEMAGHSSVTVPYFKMSIGIAQILKSSGFINGVVDEDKTLTLNLQKSGKVHHIKRISKPGRRVYVGAKDIPYVLGGKGIVIISTPAGLLTGKDARKRNVGGELLCEVY